MAFCNENKEYELEIVRGTTNTFEILVRDEDTGNPYILKSDQALVFGLKRNELDEERPLVKKLTVRDNRYYLELTPSDTMDLPVGRCYYDISLQQGTSDFFNIIKSSPFNVLPNITKLGDGS